MFRTEQIIRPTGLLDPQVSVRPVEGQIDDLIGEINRETAASKIATKLTSGISNPSLSKLIPINTSKTSIRISRIISERSKVSISEWRYLTRIPTSCI